MLLGHKEEEVVNKKSSELSTSYIIFLYEQETQLKILADMESEFWIPRRADRLFLAECQYE